MIAKISHGSSLYGVLAYNQLKVDERHADVLFTSRIIEPQGDNPYTIGHLSRSFGDYLTANRKTEKPVLHISLNPDPKDCLSEERFVSLAEEYMRRMGFGDQPYIVYRHNDIGREHLHIVSVRVDETGRSISDSYEHGRSMKVCRELERQFGLVPATPKQWKEGLPLSPVGYGDGNLKGQLAGVIRPLAREWRFRTLGEYRAVLSLYGITVDEVKGEYGGREYHGLTYSATDREGNKVGKPFKSSVFGKEAGIAALERRMHNVAAWEKTHKDQFQGEDVFKSVSVLSGGELSRLRLCMLMDEEINFLILDEPTNHLDIASREWIEEAVEAFDGTLLFVSHDRYFINRFATRVWELSDGTINDYPMGFAQYRAAKAEEKKPAPAPAQKKKQDTRPPRGGREKQAARRQLTICETGISKLEDRCRQLDREMEQYACDAEKLQELYREKQDVEAQLEQEMARWEELSLQLEE